MSAILKLLFIQTITHAAIIVATVAGVTYLFSNEYRITGMIAVIAGIRFMMFTNDKIVEYFNE